LISISFFTQSPNNISLYAILAATASYKEISLKLAFSPYSWGNPATYKILSKISLKICGLEALSFLRKPGRENANEQQSERHSD
jgi:hypothetical protein